MNEVSIDHLKEQLQEINTTIGKLEDALHQARMISGKHISKSNTGWLLSIFVEEGGTPLAVLFGNKARKWHDVIHKLEEKVLLLKVDKKIKEKEIEDALTES